MPGGGILVIPVDLGVDLHTATYLGLEVAILRTEFEALFIQVNIALIFLGIGIDHFNAAHLTAVDTGCGAAKIFGLILGDRTVLSEDVNQLIAAELAAGFTEGCELFLVDDAIF